MGHVQLHPAQPVIPRRRYVDRSLAFGVASRVIRDAGYGNNERAQMEKAERKMLKLLFATETLAVGINFSTSSVIYTGVHKFDGDSSRLLAPHEYTQISGRAGRRGIDTLSRGLCFGLCDPFPNMNRIRRVTCPVLLVHGTADQTVDCSHSIELYRRTPEAFRRQPSERRCPRAPQRPGSDSA